MLLYSIIAGSDGRDTDVSPVPIDDIPEVALKELARCVRADVSGLSGCRRHTEHRRRAGNATSTAVREGRRVDAIHIGFQPGAVGRR